MEPIIRATAVLIEEGEILLVEEDSPGKVEPSWSLPGGKLEPGETLEQCIIREMREETGLLVEVEHLLYLCDRLQTNQHVVHVTFLVKKVGGILQAGPEADVVRKAEMVPIKSICDYGYTPRFRDLAIQGFPKRGSYQGSVENIGL